MPPRDLLQECTEAMRSGVDFPTLWNTIIKPHPAVSGMPVQRTDSDGRPYLEIPLLRGDWLVIDFDAKVGRLR